MFKTSFVILFALSLMACTAQTYQPQLNRVNSLSTQRNTSVSSQTTVNTDRNKASAQDDKINEQVDAQNELKQAQQVDEKIGDANVNDGAKPEEDEEPVIGQDD